jgi:hypothetical protein
MIDNKVIISLSIFAHQTELMINGTQPVSLNIILELLDEMESSVIPCTGSSETQNKVVFAIPCIVRVDRTINEKKEMLFIF